MGHGRAVRSGKLVSLIAAGPTAGAAAISFMWPGPWVLRPSGRSAPHCGRAWRRTGEKEITKQRFVRIDAWTTDEELHANHQGQHFAPCAGPRELTDLTVIQYSSNMRLPPPAILGAASGNFIIRQDDSTMSQEFSYWKETRPACFPKSCPESTRPPELNRHRFGDALDQEKAYFSADGVYRPVIRLSLLARVSGPGWLYRSALSNLIVPPAPAFPS
jgi:hypothetical protein